VKSYANFWDHLRVDLNAGLVAFTGGAQPLPFELRPGSRWVGLIDQKDIEAKGGTIGYFYCGVIHTASTKDQLVRVRFDKRLSSSTVETDARKSGARSSP